MTESKPCPFCGRHVGHPQWDRHNEDCYFTFYRQFQYEREEMTTREAALYIATVLYPAWNRRADV